MSNLHLVTGYAGEAHITSADQGSFNAALFGNGEFVLERGNQFAASIITNNQVRVLDGDLLMQGRHIRMNENTFADLYFDNGTQGYKRIDLIVARYVKDATSDIENAELVVIKGTPSETDAVAPEHVTGDIINEQALQNDVVLYQVPFDGINIQEVVKVFNTVETLETLKKQLISDVEEKLKDVEIPMVSDIEEMKLIEKYGEYVADAKAVGEAITEMETAFQDGCDTLVSGCTTYGATPSSNSPTDIVKAIGNIYNNRYNTGYNTGYSAGVNAGTAKFSLVHAEGIVDLSTGRSKTISGFTAYLVIMVYGSGNNNPLNWGCTTTIGSVTTLIDNMTGYEGQSGCSAFLVKTGTTATVTITFKAHHSGSVIIYGL